MIRLEMVLMRRCSLKPIGCIATFSRTTSSGATDQVDTEGVRPYEEIPGPKPLPFIGNIWRFLPFIGEYGGMDPIEMVERVRKQYGDIAKITHLHWVPDVVYVFDPKDIEMMLRNEGQWPIRPIFKTIPYYRTVLRNDFFKGIEGALVSQGKQWHDFRSKVNQTMMQPRNTKQYVKPIDEVSKDFIQRMHNLRNEENKLPADFIQHLMRWALESISVIALDTRLGCLDPEMKPDSETQKMINAVNYVIKALFEIEARPSPRHFSKRKQWKEYVKAMDLINEVSMKYINLAIDRIKSRVEGGNREMSVLETLLIKNEDPMIATVMALDMMLAGIDTTANASAITLHFLARNHDKQEIVFKELESILPSKEQPIKEQNLEDMKYLKACIKESMRLSPIVAGSVRETQTSVILSKYLVPKGVHVVAPTKMTSMEEQHYPEPQHFIPERFLKGSEQHQTASPFTFLPFGFGPRMCLGRRFAELEMQILLARILRNFRLEYNQELKLRSFFINTVSSPLDFKVEDRQ